MSRKTLAWALWAIAWSLFSAASAQAEDRFARIATGGQTGVYYVAGQSICRFLNRGAAEHGITCEAPASGGGVANVKGMRSGDFATLKENVIQLETTTLAAFEHLTEGGLS